MRWARNRAFVYIRGEFFLGVKRWIKAIADAYERGFLGKNILGCGFDLDLSVHRGAGAYICGEETAMLESLEGKPRQSAAETALSGAAGLCGPADAGAQRRDAGLHPAHRARGAEWYRRHRHQQSKGPKIFCVSGHVNRPGNYELPLGTPLREIIEGHAGGMRGGRKLKAVIPGGASTPVLTADQVDTPMAFETLAAAGSALGTGAIIVMDETPAWSRRRGA